MTEPKSRNGEAAETPYKIDTGQIPMEAFSGNQDGTKGDWYVVPSWRVHFDHDGLRDFDIRLHRSVDSQAVWTLSEATTGCRITGDIPHEFYIGDETAMLAEFCAGMMKRITRESMVAQIEKALARQAGLPPRPSARSERRNTTRSELNDHAAKILGHVAWLENSYPHAKVVPAELRTAVRALLDAALADHHESAKPE